MVIGNRAKDLKLARSLIFASGTLALLSTYSGELKISFDIQIDKILFGECGLAVLDVCQRVPYGVLYLLDVTPTIVEQLIYAQFYPILVF
ncbi:unnamed protein product [Rotaria sp. Silwood1]|nr:unnamed protein product [Rotaria sp. Silwood1]